ARRGYNKRLAEHPAMAVTDRALARDGRARGALCLPIPRARGRVRDDTTLPQLRPAAAPPLRQTSTPSKELPTRGEAKSKRTKVCSAIISPMLASPSLRPLISRHISLTIQQHGSGIGYGTRFYRSCDLLSISP